MPVPANEQGERYKALNIEPPLIKIEPPPDLPPPPKPTVFYVDRCIHQWRGRLWCHLMTTGTERELRDFAARLGLHASWIQKPGTDRVHFDLTEPKREAAIAAGAIAASGMTMFRACVIAKRDATNPGNAAALQEGLGAVRDDDKTGE